MLILDVVESWKEQENDAIFARKQILDFLHTKSFLLYVDRWKNISARIEKLNSQTQQRNKNAIFLVEETLIISSLL